MTPTETAPCSPTTHHLALLTPEDRFRWHLLFKTAEPVIDIATQVLPLLTEMRAVMKRVNGISLAAPQVGISLRFFVCDFDDAADLAVVINPTILRTCPNGTKMTEGCLSYPDQWVKVWRPAWCDATWTLASGERVANQHLYGIQARVFMHELDHLNGVTIFPPSHV